MTGPDRPPTPADVPDLGDPALDPPLSIRVHPDDDPCDPAARRVVKTDAGPTMLPWTRATGLARLHPYLADEEVATWPRQHWLVAATVFRHAEHAGRPAAELDGSDAEVGSSLFRERLLEKAVTPETFYVVVPSLADDEEDR